MSASDVVPQVLVHVDTEKWGPRKAELVNLVAALQMGGSNPVPLGRKILVATGRTVRQAAHDHETLMLLADGLWERDPKTKTKKWRPGHQVLMRWKGTGTRPDCWAVADPARWRRVPWTVRREVVVERFSSPLPGGAVRLWTESAGQSPTQWTPAPDIDAQPATETSTDLSVDDRSTRKLHRSTSAQAHAQNPGLNGPQAHDDSAALSKPLGSDTPSLTPPADTSEGVRECLDDQDQNQDPGKVLLEAVTAAAKTPIFGTPADRIRQAGRDHREHLDELLAFAATLGWVLKASGAADAVEGKARALAGVRDRQKQPGTQERIDACPRCDAKGLILLPDDSVMRCDHAPDDPTFGMGFGLRSASPSEDPA